MAINSVLSGFTRKPGSLQPAYSAQRAASEGHIPEGSVAYPVGEEPAGKKGRLSGLFTDGKPTPFKWWAQQKKKRNAGKTVPSVLGSLLGDRSQDTLAG